MVGVNPVTKCVMRKAKADKIDKIMPVIGAIFLRSIFQANEYVQIFESRIKYLDPIEHGFEEGTGGLRPRLNLQLDQNGPQIVLKEVDDLLKGGSDVACCGGDSGIRDHVDRPASSIDSSLHG